MDNFKENLHKPTPDKAKSPINQNKDLGIGSIFGPKSKVAGYGHQDKKEEQTLSTKNAILKYYSA